jgi:hypothetical protein
MNEGRLRELDAVSKRPPQTVGEDLAASQPIEQQMQSVADGASRRAA